MVGQIAEGIKDTLAAQLHAARYLAVLIDGDTDISNTECEIVYVRFVEDGRPVTRLVGQQALLHAHAQGVGQVGGCDQAGVKAPGVLMPVPEAESGPVVTAADGPTGVELSVESDKCLKEFPEVFTACAVTRAMARAQAPDMRESGGGYKVEELECARHNEGIARSRVLAAGDIGSQDTGTCDWKAKCLVQMPLQSTWVCIGELELAILNLQRNETIVAKVYDLLHLVWKKYHQSPQSRRELNLIGEELGKEGSLSTDSGQYSAVLCHMDHLASSAASAEIQGRAKKIRKGMHKINLMHKAKCQEMAFSHFLADVFYELASLSLVLQKNNFILPQAISALRKTVMVLQAMQETQQRGGMLCQFMECLQGQEEISFQVC
ncbi:unnamed protein product [Boreogadus saida]